MVNKKSENNNKNDEITVELPKDITKQSITKDIDFVINELVKLKMLSNPKDRRNKTIFDILSLANKASTTCLTKLESIKTKL